MSILELRQSEGLKKLNLVQCVTHGALFSAKNPEATCPKCGPEALAATQMAKYTMGLMPEGFNPTAQKRGGTKAPQTRKTAEAKAHLKPAPEPEPEAQPSQFIPEGHKLCRKGRHVISAEAKRCLPCNNEGGKARREAQKAAQ